MNNSSKELIYSKTGWFLIGAGVGTLIALLFAPRSGKELRHEISSNTLRGIKYAESGINNLQHEAVQFYGDCTEKVSGLLETSKHRLAVEKEGLAAAIDAGRKAYQEKKTEELHMTAKA
jgi:gas vesicle protein